MLPDWVSNPGPLTCESGVLPIALHGPAVRGLVNMKSRSCYQKNICAALTVHA